MIKWMKITCLLTHQNCRLISVLEGLPACQKSGTGCKTLLHYPTHPLLLLLVYQRSLLNSFLQTISNLNSNSIGQPGTTHLYNKLLIRCFMESQLGPINKITFSFLTCSENLSINCSNISCAISIRLAVTQVCPVFLNLDAISPATAESRSAELK